MRSIHPLITTILMAGVLHGSTAAADTPTGAATGSVAESAPAAEPLDINQASAGDFERLPHVGPSRAQAIIKMRQRLGSFRRIEDLMRVRGIGRKTFRQLRTLVRVEPGARRPAKKAH